MRTNELSRKHVEGLRQYSSQGAAALGGDTAHAQASWWRRAAALEHGTSLERTVSVMLLPTRRTASGIRLGNE